MSGRRIETGDVPGLRVVTPAKTDKCRGQCVRTAPDPVADSPASVVEVRPGRRVLACDCCHEVLRYIREMGPEELRVPINPSSGAKALNPRLFRCDNCGYDVRAMAAIVQA